MAPAGPGSSKGSSNELTISRQQQQLPAAAPRRIVRQQVPDDILHDPALAAAMEVLPANYNFEIHKTVWRVRQAGAKQFCAGGRAWYDPYNRVLIQEEYDQVGMRAARKAAIQAAASARHWGVVLGTLGRQGNPRTMQLLQEQLAGRGASVTTVLLSEVSPAKLAAIGHVEAWVQIACPRLSIDWGEGFVKPTLTPYEAMIALGMVPGWWENCEGQQEQQQQQQGIAASSRGRAGAVEPYPMDYYAKDGGIWNSSYHRAVRA
eukprot:gene9330-9494_t